MIIIYLILFYLISFFMYLLIVGGNLNKSEFEKNFEDEEQIKYIESHKKRLEDKKMEEERIFIDRKSSIAYVVLALDSIYHSANKERTINDFIEEIKTMFDVHENQEQLIKLMQNIMAKKEKLLITVDMKVE